MIFKKDFMIDITDNIKNILRARAYRNKEKKEKEEYYKSSYEESSEFNILSHYRKSENVIDEVPISI